MQGLWFAFESSGLRLCVEVLQSAEVDFEGQGGKVRVSAPRILYFGAGVYMGHCGWKRSCTTSKF